MFIKLWGSFKFTSQLWRTASFSQAPNNWSCTLVGVKKKYWTSNQPHLKHLYFLYYKLYIWAKSSLWESLKLTSVLAKTRLEVITGHLSIKEFCNNQIPPLHSISVSFEDSPDLSVYTWLDLHGRCLRRFWWE